MLKRNFEQAAAGQTSSREMASIGRWVWLKQ